MTRDKTGWRAISEAPRDGTIVRLWLKPIQPDLIVPAPKTGAALKLICFGIYPHARDGYWNADRLPIFRGHDPSAPEWLGWSAASSKYEPTHFMPLPDPPETDSAE